VHYTIVTMTRGDAHKIGEWVEYHARIGFDDFQLVLDGDVDGTESVLRTLDVPAKLTVHPRREVGEYYDSLAASERWQRVLEWRREHASELASGAMRGNDAVNWRQTLHFPRVMAPYSEGQRGRGWLALIDVDEFLVLNQHRSVGGLTAGQKVPRLRFLSFNVDTTGYDPTRPVLEQHSVRWSREHLLAHPDEQWAKRVKSLVRYRVARLTAPVHKISFGRQAVLDPDIARLHHFRMPGQRLDIPFTIDDPIRMP
jgi:hypothetical protein